VKRLGIGTADYADVSGSDAARGDRTIGLPAVLKTAASAMTAGAGDHPRGDDPDQIWEDLATKSAILEAFVPRARFR
jgi:5-(carboxyamino)imidazole ribonucleotide synthase